mmetsp:Transcript_15824/g.18232  ORF Transcript_15824/g.18232 Transcript_15824/m.18232 type:complete len:163 (-) Transcript_15824:106-594(-)|eukprot:CAMPEP_0194378918 /NCGR_PEP_ID=MMETSP0174-20130528/37192_1 /TAXON_ID=216777 /ORGANISM="Proboscia alata, Strain PI-D3" /LENGTH=162 /DNA_ID=CAMNT_0039161251 /DNA_START=76 /DNA_END=564 /DNA_ORIENTATION=+
MPTYKIKEKFWSCGDDFAIKNAETDEDVFFVKGKVFSWGDDLTITDTDGNEVSHIKQKMMSLLPKYEIHKNGEKFADVQKKLSWMNQKFELDVPGDNDYSIKGSFWKHDFNFERSGEVVATVSKKVFSWSDAYSIEIVDGEDDVSILSTCIVIDQVLHDDHK